MTGMKKARGMRPEALRGHWIRQGVYIWQERSDGGKKETEKEC